MLVYTKHLVLIVLVALVLLQVVESKCGYGLTKCPHPHHSDKFTCVNLKKDEDNCGRCSNKCDIGKHCSSAKCKKCKKGYSLNDDGKCVPCKDRCICQYDFSNTEPVEGCEGLCYPIIGDIDGYCPRFAKAHLTSELDFIETKSGSNSFGFGFGGGYRLFDSNSYSIMHNNEGDLVALQAGWSTYAPACSADLQNTNTCSYPLPTEITNENYSETLDGVCECGGTCPKLTVFCGLIQDGGQFGGGGSHLKCDFTLEVLNPVDFPQAIQITYNPNQFGQQSPSQAYQLGYSNLWRILPSCK